MKHGDIDRAIVACVLLCTGLAAAHAENSLAPGQAGAIKAADVGAQVRTLFEQDWIDEDRRFSPASPGQLKGVSPPGAGSGGVTTAQDAAGGCDGIKTGKWGFHAASGELDPWWQVDLGREYRLDRVVIYNRTDGGTAPRTRNIRVLVAPADAAGGQFKAVYRHNGETFYGVKENKPLVVDLKGGNVTARIVRLDVPGRCSFALDEVEVYGADDPRKNVALGKKAGQKSVGPYSYPPAPKAEAAGLSEAPAGGGAAGGGFSLAHTRQVVERARRLIERLASGAGGGRLDPLRVRLHRCRERLSKLETAGQADDGARRETYFEARGLLREIALCNPLLDFDKLLFITRHDAGGCYHMCDQYYGFNARPGGGLFVLSDPLGPAPRLTNLLENSVVQAGRLKGRKLEGGSFLSPDLSYDGRTILFAWTQAKGKDLEWSPTSSYHVFKVNADGTGLVQLTDGPWNDFDPCFLPSGRIVFISERRGGYLRCGRHSPVYTMFSMASDGSDVACMSFHETHEWHPSVDNDGMIVYTRWDYVDRDTNIAHHIWTCYPDGREPRSFHGNYPQRREGRPWMEMSIRAIPGSPRYVATAAAHHAHAFGSLVLIDPQVRDDGAVSQLTRLTPDAPFPEAERGRGSIRQDMVYGTAWPLGEDDYLCVYDPQAKNHGVYWIDRFGNRELIYRCPPIACQDPIPLRPRPMPPVIPDQAGRLAESARKAAGAAPSATVSLVNVYDGDFTWPEGTRIAALRIIQVLPKTTPPPNQPRIGVAEQTNARAVLGTVSVEADGSAHFEAPAGRAMYFQALDERGMAVQSMRSATYLQPGERRACRGCHEPKHQTPAQPEKVPLALRRPPSRISSDVDGANPFNYVRLVQPVLDRNCVECHRQKQAIDLTGVIEGKFGWTRSYANLAGKYGFYFHVTNGSINGGVHGGSRTIAGRFGARASGLLKYMDERHYGVRLPREDFHRLTLWLDCNSEFYGSYEDTQAQARGEVVPPSLD